MGSDTPSNPTATENHTSTNGNVDKNQGTWYNWFDLMFHFNWTYQKWQSSDQRFRRNLYVCQFVSVYLRWQFSWIPTMDRFAWIHFSTLPLPMQKHYVDPMFVFSMQFFVDVFVNNITVSILNIYTHFEMGKFFDSRFIKQSDNKKWMLHTAC